MDRLYDSIVDEHVSLLTHFEISAHLIFCPRCAGEVKRLEAVREILREDFFSLPPDLEEGIMASLQGEFSDDPGGEAAGMADPFGTAGNIAGVSFRGWVITGFIVLVSLVSLFFTMDFENIARSQGSSFLLPIGLTIGAVLTCYGALFIASHLKELSERFGLH
jgi:hypothetical protein